MTSNEFSLDSSSDSEVSEIEDYEIEVEHRVIISEVVSSTPTGPTLRVLK